MNGLLNRKQAARALGMGLPAFRQFEIDNPEVIAAAAVKRTRDGKTYLHYRRGPLMAWLYGSQIAPSTDIPQTIPVPVDGATLAASGNSPSDAAPSQQGAAA